MNGTVAVCPAPAVRCRPRRAGPQRQRPARRRTGRRRSSAAAARRPVLLERRTCPGPGTSRTATTGPPRSRPAACPAAAGRTPRPDRGSRSGRRHRRMPCRISRPSGHHRAPRARTSRATAGRPGAARQREVGARRPSPTPSRPHSGWSSMGSAHRRALQSGRDVPTACRSAAVASPTGGRDYPTMLARGIGCVWPGDSSSDGLRVGVAAVMGEPRRKRRARGRRRGRAVRDQERREELDAAVGWPATAGS